MSIRGCRIHGREATQDGERDQFLKKDSQEINHGTTPNGKLGFLENLLHIVYQVCLAIPFVPLLSDGSVYASQFSTSSSCRPRIMSNHP